MARNPQPGQRLPFRRRLDQRTDYKARLALLKSGKPRLVVRRSLNSMRIQVVNYEKGGDKTVVEETSKSLRKLGWKGHTGNLPASYLTGLMAGSKALQKGVKECVLDMGLHTVTKGSGLFAAVKGAVDAGLKIPVSEEMLPSDERLKGGHIARWAKGSGAGIENNFEEVKKKIMPK